MRYRPTTLGPLQFCMAGYGPKPWIAGNRNCYLYITAGTLDAPLRCEFRDIQTDEVLLTSDLMRNIRDWISHSADVLHPSQHVEEGL